MIDSVEYRTLLNAYLSESDVSYEDARLTLDEMIMQDESDVYLKTEDLLAAAYSQSVDFGDWVKLMLMTLATEREDAEIGDHVGRLFAIPFVATSNMKPEVLATIRESSASRIQAMLEELYAPEDVTLRVQPFLLSAESIHNQGWVSISRMLSTLHEGAEYCPQQFVGIGTTSRVWFLIVYAEAHIVDEEALDALQSAFSREHYEIIGQIIHNDTWISPFINEQLFGMAPLDTLYLMMQSYDRKLRMTAYLEGGGTEHYLLKVTAKHLINGDAFVDAQFGKHAEHFTWERGVGEQSTDALHAFNQYMVALQTGENLPDIKQIH